MKRTKSMFLALVLLSPMAANATLITFDPSDQTIDLGETTTVDIVISDLSDDILTGYDLDVLFDNTILSYGGFTFGTDCGGFSCLDILGFGNLSLVADLGGGLIDIFELSFDFDEDLIDFQPNAFVLGTFTFTGIGVGTSALDIDYLDMEGQYVFDADLGYSIPKSLQADTQSGSITVVSVPEPGTLALLGIGLCGMGLARRRKV